MNTTREEMERRWATGKWIIKRIQWKGRASIILIKYPACDGVSWIWQYKPSCSFSAFPGASREDSGIYTSWSNSLVEGVAPPLSFAFVAEKLGEKEEDVSY